MINIINVRHHHYRFNILDLRCYEMWNVVGDQQETNIVFC